MLSVIIATLDSEPALARTLAALVPGATAGLVSEVLVSDGGSNDETAIVADVAGCNFTVVPGPLGGRLKAAAAAARAPWLLFLRPGTIPDTSWVAEAAHFVGQASSGAPAAVFRLGASERPALRQAWLLVAAALGRARPEQGLIVSKQFYQAIGGHSAEAADPEADLLRRIGRRRIVTLSTAAFGAGRYLT
jgi:glycosyltransferase involved in cell wall biosynthesis